MEGRPPVTFDVRSPEEFSQGHIPRAESLPLLSDGDRKEVGTLHRKVGRDEAFDLALERVYPSLPSLLQQAEERCSEPGGTIEGEEDAAQVGPPSRHVLVYCKRGGMRSRSVASFLAAHGFEVYVLEGGYKAFRTWAEAVLKRPQKVCSVAGATGSGKTEVLQELRRLGMQTVDLEALACHKGSVFGHLGEGPQPSSEHFRNVVAERWASLDSERFVYLEDEGPRIGGVSLPGSLYRRLRRAQLVVHLDVPFELRAERSLATYGPFGAEALSEAVSRFRTKMGDSKTESLLDLLASGDLRSVCEEVLRNYDRTYEHHLRKARNARDIVRVPVSSLDAAAAARGVVDAASPREPNVSPALQDEAEVPASSSDSDAAAAARGVAAAASPREPNVSPALQEEAEADAVVREAAVATREAHCLCGAVAVRVRGEPLSVSMCHCSVCRKLSGAPFVASALFEPACVEVRGGGGSADVEPELAETRTSPAVVRRRCAACFSPVVGVLGKRYVAVPLALFNWDGKPPPPAWRPQRHLHYEDRVLDMEDGLPKYAGRSGGALWTSPEQREV